MQRNRRRKCGDEALDRRHSRAVVEARPTRLERGDIGEQAGAVIADFADDPERAIDRRKLQQRVGRCLVERVADGLARLREGAGTSH